MIMMMIIMIITGGWHTMTTVSVYSEAGHQRDLVMMMRMRMMIIMTIIM